ncbi:MAG: MlrC C-terminal domain-containing protein [Proteobacteria bacterium]|nr:MlrC C-terminal domain-containing protein [Pseudomonadota bacterium]
MELPVASPYLLAPELSRVQDYRSQRLVATEITRKETVVIIDTHTHFYDPSRPEGVPWPSANDEVLYRTVLPEDFRKLAEPVGVTGTVVVEKLGDGAFTATGPMWRGSRMRLGPMALLRVADSPGVRVIVASRKLQAGDQAIFRHLGVEPAEQRILVLKSSVHFRADFQDIAAEVLVVAAPGPNPADPAELPYRRLREGVRLNPLGPPHRRPR